MKIDMLPPPVLSNPLKRAEPAKAEIEYRELTPTEIATVEHVFMAAGAVLPDPRFSTFVGAVQGDKVLGFIVLQLRLHAEPMWIEGGHSDLFQPIIKQAEATVLARSGPQWVYLFTPAGRTTQLAASMGCKLEPWCVMSKLVTHEVPNQPLLDFGIDEPDVLPVESPVDELRQAYKDFRPDPPQDEELIN